MKKILCLLWLGSSSLALAQDLNPAPNKAELTLDYTSAFTFYKPYIEQGVANWSVLNEQVKGGGHAGHDMSGMAHDGMSVSPEKHAHQMDSSKSHHEHEMH